MEALSIFKDFSHTSMKDPFHALKFIGSICLSEIYFGYTLIYLSAVDFPVIAHIFSIDFDIAFAQGLFQGIVPIGGAFGAYLSSFLIARLSRRQVLHLLALMGSILCVLSVYRDYRVFFIVRFLQGACAGMLSSVIPMIVREAAPLQLASIAGSLPNLFIIFGLFFLYLFAFVLGLLSGDPTGAATWKIVFLFPIVIMAVQTYIIYRYYPLETPKYLAQNKRKSQLRSFIQQFYKCEYVDQHYQYILKHYGPRQSIYDTVHHSHYQSRAAFIYGIFYALLCPLVGINVMFSYCNDIAAKIFPFLRPVIGAIMLLLFFISSAVSINYVTKYGRKEITLWGTYGLAIVLFIMAFGYFIADTSPSLAQIIVFMTLVLYLFVYGLTYAPIMWMWLAQAFQPSNIGLAVAANWSGAAFIMITFPIVQNIVPNQGYIFAFFGTLAILSVMVTKRLMLQTKDKTEHQITEQYRALDKELWSDAQQRREMQQQLIQRQRIK